MHKLIWHHARHGADHDFSVLQVEDAIEWLVQNGVKPGPRTRALDLGCSSGVFGDTLMRRGCSVTFVDEKDWLADDIPRAHFRRFNIDTESLTALGSYDLVVCSNVLEHLRDQKRFIATMSSILNPTGWFYLSWTHILAVV